MRTHKQKCVHNTPTTMNDSIASSRKPEHEFRRYLDCLCWTIKGQNKNSVSLAKCPMKQTSIHAVV